jgi:probable O-glycosylation ligase (exosortase A-associated)
MRDVILTLVVFGSLPFILKRPWFGILMWVWISVMNPHRLSWGFAYDMPFALIIAVCTIISLVFSRGPKSIPWMSLTVLLLLFVFWMNVTTLFAIQSKGISELWERVMKMMLMTFVTIMLIREREHIHWLIWALAVSLGFYGVKGGIFTVLGGGANLVWGPPDSAVADNNHLATGLIIIIPLMWYLRLQSKNQWVRLGLLGAMLLSAFSALGSYSRGALLAIAAMAVFLWWKSSHKTMLALVLVFVAPLLVSFMPDKWTTRMETISAYQEDSSALGRINAWQMAFNLAKDRPLVGGGFQIYEPSIFARYAPVADDVHAAHSIYFSCLGEHGFVGLLLFLLLGIAAWRTGSWVVRNVKGHEKLTWARDLALMIQVSLIGYAVGGAFLSLLYFDVPYYLIAALVALRRHVEFVLSQEAASVALAPSSRKGATQALPVRREQTGSG